MICFNSLTPFSLKSSDAISSLITQAILDEAYKVGMINYIFCDDKYLLDINIKYLNHNTLTDIISFDETLGRLISGDIFISIERVQENAITYNVSFEEELLRVMIHGVLHFCGYNDKTKEQKKGMRSKEDYYLSLRDF